MTRISPLLSCWLWSIVLVLLAERTFAAAAPVSKVPPPNILFAIADDWGFGHAGAYGCSWVRTPAFDRVAEQGILFTRAYTPNAKCAPSRACILTGRNSWQLGAAANHGCFFPAEYKTFFEALGENGWFVGHTAKGWSPGVATNSMGRRELTGKAFNARTTTPPTSGISANDYTANFLNFLDAVPGGKPWCFWYGALEPHRRYEYGSGVGKGGKSITDIDRVPGFWPDNEVVRNDMLDYALEVEHFDRHLSRMLRGLEERQLLSNTLVIVTSDHGMPFPRVKGQAYEMANHVPLALMWPSGIAKPGREVRHEFVSFIDLAPTILELAGLDWGQSGMAPATGRSIADLLFSRRASRTARKRDHVLIGKERHDVGRPNDVGYPIRGIVKGDWLFIRNYETRRWPAGNPETGYLNTDGGATKTEILNARRAAGTNHFWSLCFGKRPETELYDLRNDPDCTTNLAPSRKYAQVRRTLEFEMTAELKAQGDPRMLGRGHIFDEYPYAAESQRGFYERYMRGDDVKAGWVYEGDFERDLNGKSSQEANVPAN